MDRFFSKLDLRDIKIKPEGSRFLPDEDEVEVIDEPVDGFVFDRRETIEHHRDRPSMSASLPEQTVISSLQPTNLQPSSASKLTPGSRRLRLYGTTEPSQIGPAQNNAEVLKVSAKSRPSAVAGAIAGVVRENGRAEVQAIGAGATNQAIKAIAIAREYLLETDIDAICIPAFIDVTIDNEERTAIRLVIETR